MNNNNEQISRYLQGDMSQEEKVAFEKQLSFDFGLQQEVIIQRQIMQAAINAGLKAEFARAIHKKAIINRSLKWGLAIAAGVMLVLLFNFRNTLFPAGDMEDNRIEAMITLPFINPPMPEINVPLAEYIFDAEKGTTIFHASGSIITFPASSLIDGAGNLVKGKVKVTYREFADPIDFFVSGIPMSYDSAGRRYNFESSGMCEINAYKDEKPVFVNKNAQPQIHLSTNNKSPEHNLYYLDSVKRKWNYLGKDKITEVKNIVQVNPANQRPISTVSIETTVKPVMPVKASEDKQAFSIDVDPLAFTELISFDKLKFQVEDESTYNRSDAEEQWDNVELNPTNKEGIYTLSFSNTRRKVSYKVRPVLEGEDYEAALKTFKQKNAAYEMALQQRIVLDKNMSDSIISLNKKNEEEYNAAFEENEKLNARIIARNNFMREQRKRAKEEAEKMEAMNKQQWEEQLRLMDVNQRKFAENYRVSNEIIRSFTINNFGVWNCDYPSLPPMITLTADILDSTGMKISFAGMSMIYKGFNGIVQCYPPYLRIQPKGDNMLWGVKDNYFHYFTYQDFAAVQITRDTKGITIRMRRSEKVITSYQEIRELVGAL